VFATVIYLTQRCNWITFFNP